MPDLQEADSAGTLAEAPAGAKTPEPKKRAPREKKAKAQPRQAAGKNGGRSAGKVTEVQAPTARGVRKVHSKEERARRLSQIETMVKKGESLKNAVRQAGISDQTYYQWRRAERSAAPADDLRDLLVLEEENKRLKKQLAARLRQENAELRKKLGLK